jgi:imidazolonepropionase
MRMLFTHIKGLVGAYEEAPAYLAGESMNEFPVLEDAWLAVEGGRIVDFGLMADFPGILDWTGLQVVDCQGRFVLPSWVDSHTHLVYAANRSGEFSDRLNGLSYQTIAERGGGILHSAFRLQEMSEDELYDAARARLELALADGIGAMEIKTGYGLTVEAELKMLRVIQRLKTAAPIPVKCTLLGLHAIPHGLDAASWTQVAMDELLPKAIEMGGVDYVDAFCEQGYFGLQETRSWLEAAAAAGIPAKVHVNQFNAFGGVGLCAQLGAVSVDHLEEIGEGDIAALQSTLGRSGAPMFPVALPGCSHFLSIPFTPGRELIDAGLPLALATDHNPGSSPSGSMRFAVQLAIVKMRLRPLEAIAAATLNGAAAMGVAHEVGAIAPGHRANLLLTKPMDDLIEVGYRFSEDFVERVFMNGVEMPH